MEGNRSHKDGGPKWFTRTKLIAAVLIVISLVGIAALALANQHRSASSSQKARPATRTPTPTPVAVTQQKPLTLQSTAVGDESKRFATAEGQDWDLEWSYDCSKHGQGVFIVSVYDGAGHASAETPPVIQSGRSGGGVQHYHKSGTHFFNVRSQCKWRLNVKAVATTPSPTASATPLKP